MYEATATDPSGTRPRVLLSMEGVGKSYGSFAALADVDLSISRGSIHGLLGENGAGKSTLVGIISGQKQRNAGRVVLDGNDIERADVKSMEGAGVFLVTQEPMIIDHLSAAENLMLGVWPSRRGMVDWRKLNADAERILADTDIPAGARAGSLGAVARRKINILRAMFSGGTLIILDEPTAALTVEDRDQLFDFMRRLKGDGVTFIFISHYNDEILEICDAVTVLRDGVVAGSADDLSGMTSEHLSELVLGRGLELFERKRSDPRVTAEILEIRDVRGGALNVPHLDIKPGEVVGFAGLPGAGAKELARALFGLVGVESGTLRIPGHAASSPLPRTPGDALRAGIAYLSDDRRGDGAVSQMTVGQNISLSSLDRISHRGFLNSGDERRLSAHYFDAMEIKAAGADSVVDTLSGGNQQKVCLARVLATEPRLLILDEPTRGIDVGVKQDVLRIIDRLTDTGVCVILVSTDTDELVRSVDRICLFADGGIVSELHGERITSERLRELMGARRLELPGSDDR